MDRAEMAAAAQRKSLLVQAEHARPSASRRGARGGVNAPAKGMTLKGSTCTAWNRRLARRFLFA